MRPHLVAVVPLTAALVSLFACGARSDLAPAPGASAGTTSTASTTSTTSTSTTTTPSTSPTCDPAAKPDCGSCGGTSLDPWCDAATWVCPHDCGCLPVTWQAHLGGAGTQSGEAIHVGPGGDAAVLVTFDDAVQLFGLDTFHTQSFDALVVRVAPDGAFAWATPLLASAGVEVDSVGIDAAGGIAVLGRYEGDASVLGVPLPAGSPRSLFLVRFDPQGAVAYVKTFVGGANGTYGTMTVAPSGEVVIAGDTAGTLVWDDGSLDGSFSREPIVIALDPAGKTRWARRFPPAVVDPNPNAFATAVALGPGGEVVVAGAFNTTFDFGLGPHVSAGDFDLFALRFSADGQLLESRADGGPGRDLPQSVAVGPAGEVVVAASVEPGATIGGQPLPGAGDTVVASFDGLGALRWARALDGPVAKRGSRVAVRPDAVVVFGGNFRETVTMDGASVTSAGGSDVILATFDKQGAVLGACRYGGPSVDDLGGLSVDPGTGDLLLTGFYAADLDFGAGPWPPPTAQGDGFLVRLSAASPP